MELILYDCLNHQIAELIFPFSLKNDCVSKYERKLV